MSDPLIKVEGIRQLPIFPLPLVMLPNELLPLHIFEDRYRQMLKDISSDKNFFGIVLYEPDSAFDELPAVGTVGCVAEVRESEILDDGRSNILTLGVVRFRITGYPSSLEPYLVAEIEFFEDSEGDPGLIGPISDEVFELFERLAKAAFKMSGSRGQFPEIQRSDPESLSFLIAAAFNFDNDKKYKLIETSSTLHRLTELKKFLEQAVGQIEESSEILTVAKTNGHSKKKLDL